MFFLTTIANNLVAIVEMANAEARQRGEYILSSACVQKNLDAGTFVEVNASEHRGRVFVLSSDLNAIG